MGLPKRRISRHRRGNRRAHQSLTARSLGECRQCHTRKPTHTVCPNCGWYAGRTVIETEES